MTITDSSRDYCNNTITVIYDNEYCEDYLLRYLLLTYGSYYYKIISYSEPNNYKGLYNPGSCDIQIFEYRE